MNQLFSPFFKTLPLSWILPSTSMFRLFSYEEENPSITLVCLLRSCVSPPWSSHPCFYRIHLGPQFIFPTLYLNTMIWFSFHWYTTAHAETKLLFPICTNQEVITQRCLYCCFMKFHMLTTFSNFFLCFSFKSKQIFWVKTVITFYFLPLLNTWGPQSLHPSLGLRVNKTTPFCHLGAHLSSCATIFIASMVLVLVSL